MLLTFRLRMRAEGWVALLGVCACAVVFSGRLQSADEIAIYALAYNLGQRGALDINALASTAPGMRAPPFSGIGQFGPDGNFYSGKGVLPSLLALPLIRLSALAGADPVIAALALNSALTALTACIIARYVRRELGDARAAFWSGALYLAGSMALAYAKRLFTEPAAALCVTLAFVALGSRKQSDARHIGAGLALGAAAAASYSNLVLLPGFVALIAIRSRRAPVWRRLAWLVAGMMPWLIGLAVYNLVRFASPLNTGLALLAWSAPYFTPQAALVRIYGLLISPYRGFILYNPLLLLLPLAWIAMRIEGRAPRPTTRRPLIRLALLLASSGTAAYALFFSLWSMWWGGFNWGPRFLLPILPIWAITLAPACRMMLTPTARTSIRAAVVRIMMWMVTALAVLIAGIGGLADVFRSEGALARSGALGALVMPEALSASPLLTEVSAFQAIAGLEQIAQGHLDVWWAQPVPRDEDLARALSDVAERATPASEVVLMAPAQVEAFLHAYRLPNAVLGLSPDQITQNDDAPAQRLLRRAQRILLVTDAAQLDPGNTTERWLERHAFRARNEFYGRWRVAVFGAPVTPTALITPSAAFGDALMLVSVRYSPIVRPGGVVALEATWQRAGAAGNAFNTIAWFAHLLATDGSLVSQHDALLGSGYPWDADAVTLVDHRGILVPPNARPGAHRVRIGAYTSDGALLGEPVTLDIRIQ